MASSFLDNCGFNPTLGGTTDWTYSSVLAGGYQSPTAAGAVTATPYSYYAKDPSGSPWEMGSGLCTITGGVPTFARTTVLYNSSGTGTGAGQSGAGTKISFATAPQVSIVALAEDLPKLGGPTITRLASGTAATYTTPVGCKWLRIRMVGSGSGASGSGTGAGNAGTPTASTWSGGSLSAGGAAQGQQLATGNPGGTASGGNVANISGQGGSPAGGISGTAGNPGANSILGGAGLGTLGSNAGGNAATNSGSGGGTGAVSATVTTGVSGGAGAYVEHIISSPAATYTYTVGAGSTGGTAGTNGQAGGNGAAGVIIVEEYYN
jgi:hypothetical protein